MFAIITIIQKIIDSKKYKRGEQWERVIDFTEIKKGGLNIDEVLKKL